MSTNRYPDYMMRTFRERLDLDPNDTSRDWAINSYMPDEAFSEMLGWEGLMGGYV